MLCAKPLIALFLFHGCDDQTSNYLDQLHKALEHPARSQEDRTTDQRRKPGDVLAFFEVSSGMTVLDLFAGSGYYSEIVSYIVGPDGRVITHNNKAYLEYVEDELARRFHGGDISNVTTVVAEANELPLEPASLDATLMILTYHDFYYVDENIGWPKIDTQSLLDKLCQAMKPGAVLGVVDHVALPDSGASAAQDLHRIEPAYVKSELESSCFEFVAESNALRNSSDQHHLSMGAPEVRGQTDRFIYKFKRR